MRSRAAAAIAAMLCGVAVAGSGAADADPVSAAADPIIARGAPLATPVTADGSRIEDFRVIDDRNVRLLVYSAAMRKAIQIDVQRPADTSQPRPVLYLFSGAGGGQDETTWRKRTTALNWLADKNANIVQPVGGMASYYTDWRAPDPVLGVNMWKTFFTRELPPLVDAALGTNGRNALVGMSMSGTSVLQLAVAAPGLFRSVASYSGCAQISDPTGYAYAALVVRNGRGDPDNMYGPQGDPLWAANDPYVHADQLRGTNLFISSGTGAPGAWDTLDGPYTQPGVGGLANQLILGGIIESAVNTCTRNLQTRLADLAIPATWDLTSTGTHSWGYWQDALVRSWPVLADGLGLPA
ncbi:alpha/beta hydrolase [Nocardia acididurans]|nr:alpha/beta hydrolase family protein [Nocardia acididurans]